MFTKYLFNSEEYLVVEMCVSVPCKVQNKRKEFVYVFTTLSKEYLLKIISFFFAGP